MTRHAFVAAVGMAVLFSAGSAKAEIDQFTLSFNSLAPALQTDPANNLSGISISATFYGTLFQGSWGSGEYVVEPDAGASPDSVSITDPANTTTGPYTVANYMPPGNSATGTPVNDTNGFLTFDNILYTTGTNATVDSFGGILFYDSTGDGINIYYAGNNNFIYTDDAGYLSDGTLTITDDTPNPVQVGPTPAPEPMSIAVLGTAMLGLLAARRRRA